MASAGRFPLRFFLEDGAEGGRIGAWETWRDSAPPAAARVAQARAALREAQRVEWDERQRLARARADGLTASDAALLQARQAQLQAAQTAVEDLRRRAVGLRQAIALGEEALLAQRRLLDRLRRELAELGD